MKLGWVKIKIKKKIKVLIRCHHHWMLNFFQILKGTNCTESDRARHSAPPDAEIKLAADFQSAADFRPQIGSGETGGQAVGTRSSGNRANLETSSDGQNDPQLWPPPHFATGNVQFSDWGAAAFSNCGQLELTSFSNLLHRFGFKMVALRQPGRDWFDFGERNRKAQPYLTMPICKFFRS